MLETLPAGADLFFCLLAWKQFPGTKRWCGLSGLLAQ